MRRAEKERVALRRRAGRRRAVSGRMGGGDRPRPAANRSKALIGASLAALARALWEA
jgi:hypothetical protein